MYPALCARDQSPRPGRVTPRLQAEAILAKPTTTQYAMAKPTVDQKIMIAFPYGEDGRGSSGVVSMSRHRSSLLNVSTARSRVIRVVSSLFLPQGMVDEKAKGPRTIGQYVPSGDIISGSGDSGRMFWHRYELFVHAFRVRTDVVVNNVAGGVYQ